MPGSNCLIEHIAEPIQVSGTNNLLQTNKPKHGVKINPTPIVMF